jgi:hypothetical protein
VTSTANETLEAFKNRVNAQVKAKSEQIATHLTSQVNDDVQSAGLLFNATVCSQMCRPASGSGRVNSRPAGFSVFLTCFLPRTMISMADGSKKPIEQLRAGDKVRSFTTDQSLSITEVAEVHPARRTGI